ncbi:type II secretion system F family protein [Pectobacterium atrosepticum]|uniref:type II secretion system F family protein n=1 Tax=Pectobacterium atrosepticum TaxID=29471 RepID=UPI003017630B
MREMSLFQRLRYLLVRSTFTGKHRIKFYAAILFLIQNKRTIMVAFENIRDTWTDFGQRWHPYSELTNDCIYALRENTDDKSLEIILSKWLPSAESAVINAGLRSGTLPQALEYAKDLTEARKKIMKSIWQMAIYPIALIFMTIGTLYILNTQLIPVLSQMSPPENWTGILRSLYEFSIFLDDYGLMCFVIFLTIISWIIWSMPNWYKPDKVRRIFDSIMPWSVYQDIQGASFLLNVAALTSAGVNIKRALDILQKSASPWLAVRIESVIYHVRNGKHFGLALKESGYNFPSREAVNFLSLLEGDGAETVISNYGQEWLKQTISRVSERAIAVRLLMLVLIVSALLLLVLLVIDILQMSDQSMGGF